VGYARRVRGSKRVRGFGANRMTTRASAAKRATGTARLRAKRDGEVSPELQRRRTRAGEATRESAIGAI